MTEVKKIKVLNFANIVAVIYACLGFLLGAGFYFYFLIQTLFRSDVLVTSWWGFATNLLYVLASGALVSVFSLILGWILGIIFACTYNLVAPRIGGIKVDLGGK